MLEVGQVLSLRIRYNMAGQLSDKKHPYLILNIDKENSKIVEVAQIDSLKGKEYKAFFKSNKVIYKSNEIVIDKDSYIQKDNQFLLEYYDELERYRRQDDKLSEIVLKEVIKDYYDYHNKNILDENKCVYMDRNEIERLNN